MQIQKKQKLSQLRRWRIRKTVIGTAQRPRMAVKFTGEHIYVQFIDDAAGRTLVATSTQDKTIADRATLAANVTSATRIGKLAAEAAVGKGIKNVVFDRAGARYHGKVKALADAAREGGLKF
ncbi:MAG: 50S ribosomal protein L18 [Pedosphaera sp.]|nr:50S ribosomal protein L18 [Pedosphaera sp.]